MAIKDFKEAEEIELNRFGCSVCGDEVDTCHECDESLEDETFYCAGFGEHYCKKCAKKTKPQKGRDK